MASANLKISRVLHAGYVFEYGETRIAFDPIFENPFSRNCYAYPSVRFDLDQIKQLKFSAVFISHHHDDHCSLESLDLLDRSTPVYLYCLHEELFEMLGELGFENVRALEIDSSVNVGSLEVIPRRALDSDVDSLFQIRAGDLNVLNVVDSWIDPSTLEQLATFAPWDMVLWPFQTMREIAVIAPSREAPASTELPYEWIDHLRILKPRYVVPSSCQFVQESWSWYNHAMFPISYGQFEREVRSSVAGVEVVRMNPSVSVALGRHSLERAEPLTWVQPIGEQEVDYEYDETLTPPTTAEVARHFAPLGREQSLSVFAYCQTKLLESFRAIELSEDSYFVKPRLWRLSLFDHSGEETRFLYRIEGQTIEKAEEEDGPLAWVTEVPTSKLHAALYSGESLTSMYVRINDVTFEPEIEKEVGAVDVLEDPLVRCLFDGSFGAYQRAQLKKLMGRNSGST